MKILFVDLNSFNIDLNYLQSFLSDAEKARSNLITSMKAKRNFICGRVLIKTTLAARLACNPLDVVLKTTKDGRPEIHFPSSKLHFNISHSNDYIILGISEKPIGVDIEYLRDRNFLDIAEYFFDKKEFENLQNTKILSERKRIFYSNWTKKEAFIKCDGKKLFDKLTDFSQKYQCFTINLNQDYIVSLVCRGERISLPPQKSIEICQILDFQSGANITKIIDLIV